MRDLQENNVPSEHQNEECYFPQLNSGIRVLFVGNSITKHAPKPEIGWTNDCGMEASSVDKDYVHLVEEKIREKHKDASFAILQVADFERNFESFQIEKEHREAIDFNADIIIMFFGANVTKEYDKKSNPKITFGERYEKLRNALNKHGKAKILHLQGFYIRPVLDAEKKKVAEKYNDEYAELGEIRTSADTHGHFNHPNDKGMADIAQLIWKIISKWV